MQWASSLPPSRLQRDHKRFQSHIHYPRKDRVKGGALQVSWPVPLRGTWPVIKPVMMLPNLLLRSRFSHVQVCAIPWMAAHQAPLSLGFSRQEHWSGFPFPFPRHESEKWKWSCSAVSDSSATPWTAAHQAPLTIGFSRQEYWSWLPLPSLASKPILT